MMTITADLKVVTEINDGRDEKMLAPMAVLVSVEADPVRTRPSTDTPRTQAGS